MKTLIPFIPAHLKGFDVHDDLAHIREYLQDDSYGDLLASMDMSYSAIVDGNVIAIAGFYPAGKGRFLAWTLMSKDTGKYMLRATREVLQIINGMDYRRIETPVKRDFLAGHKWMRLLGFENETPNGMRNYEDGMTFDLYARVK